MTSRVDQAYSNGIKEGERRAASHQSLSKALLAALADNIMDQAANQMTQAENEQAAGEIDASFTSLAAAKALRYMARAVHNTANRQVEFSERSEASEG